jgi:hypothetical protein
MAFKVNASVWQIRKKHDKKLRKMQNTNTFAHGQHGKAHKALV